MTSVWYRTDYRIPGIPGSWVVVRHVEADGWRASRTEWAMRVECRINCKTIRPRLKVELALGRKMQSIRLHRQVCAFIDVLGGAKLFLGKDRERAADFFACLEEFERRLNCWSSHFPKNRRSTKLVKTFSDNIFVAFPFGSSSKMSDEQVVSTFLNELAHQIYELTILAGFPIRGAVSAGSLMFTDKYLFGPALVDAVQLEKEAVFPRLILSNTVLRYVKPDSPSARLVLRDSDGRMFLHYLSGGHGLKRHREYVKRGLLENTSRVHERQKYEWLAQYHNFSANLVGNSELEVSIDRPSAFSPFQTKGLPNPPFNTDWPVKSTPAG